MESNIRVIALAPIHGRYSGLFLCSVCGTSATISSASYSTNNASEKNKAQEEAIAAAKTEIENHNANKTICGQRVIGVCKNCKGVGTVEQPTNCTHNKSANHYYCSTHGVDCGPTSNLHYQN